MAEKRSLTLVAGTVALLLSAARAEQVDSTEGNDANVEKKTGEAAAVALDALVPVDRSLYDAKQRWKEQLKSRAGIEFALESTTIYQATSGDIDANDAIVNTTGIFGIWSLWRHENQIDRLGIGFQAETRGNFSGDDFPQMQSDLGTIWSPNDSTSNDYSKINQLWFGHKFNDGRVIYLIGKVDPGSQINGNRLAGSGNTQFFGQPFATNPAKSFPDNGIGAIVRVSPREWMHIQGVISDSDAIDKHSPFTTIEGNWLYAAEVMFKPQLEGLGQGNYRFMLYYRDTEPQATHGWALSFDQNLGESVGLFLRYGGNDGDFNSIEHIVSAGVSLLKPFGRANDQTGIGVSWTVPSDTDLRHEYSAETYYRLQLTNFTELSGSAQLILDPSGNDADALGVFGLRMRVLF